MQASIQILAGSGYVWSADVAHWLRLECGIVGAMVGGVAGFKQQNAVHGLPLELSPEEVTLVLERGWGQLQAPLHTGQLAAAADAEAGKKRAREEAARREWHEEDFDEMASLDGDEDLQADGSQSDHDEEEPAWRAALAQGAAFTIPLVPACLADGQAVQLQSSKKEAADRLNGATAESDKGRTGAGRAGAASGTASDSLAAAAAAAAEAVGAAPGRPQPGAADAVPPQAAAAQQALQWSFPETREERHRYWVFRDLHSKGYRLTGGSKFGADYLVYPGDPTLYHAQFCVRLMPYDQPILPAMLASATRGSHQARKHLLIASVVEEDYAEGRAGGQAAEAATIQPRGGTGSLGTSTAAAAAPDEQQPRQTHNLGASQQQAANEEGTAVVGSQPCRLQSPSGTKGWQLGCSSHGIGSTGQHFSIHYMTIGPVDGFG